MEYTCDGSHSVNVAAMMVPRGRVTNAGWAVVNRELKNRGTKYFALGVVSYEHLSLTGEKVDPEEDSQGR